MRNIQDPVAAAKLLVDHALARFSTDNLSCMVVRFDKQALLDNQHNKENPIGVEGDEGAPGGKISEADKIVSTTRQKIAESGSPAVGVSASNSGRGYDPAPLEESESFVPTTINGVVEEEPSSIDDDDDDDDDDDAPDSLATTPVNSAPVIDIDAPSD